MNPIRKILGTVTYATLMISAGCSSSPSARDADLRILDRNIIGATYVVCGSAISWDGITFSFEGLEGDVKTRKFTLGKLNYAPTKIRELDTIGLGVDAMFRQMCQSTIALRGHPDQLGSYIIERDKTALKLFGLLSKLESINKTISDPTEAVSQQQKLFSDVKNEKS